MNSYLIISSIFAIVSIATSRFGERGVKSAIFSTIVTAIYLFLTVAYLSADFFTAEGVNEAVIYTIEYGLQDAGFRDYIALISAVVVAIVVIFAMSYLYLKFVRSSIYPKRSILKRYIHNTTLLLAFLTHPIIYDLASIYRHRHIESSIDAGEYYRAPTIGTKTTNGKNIVYIYAESLERRYFDEQEFPNLTPELKPIISQSTEFTDIRQVTGTGWTIGGMVASQCAIPLFTPSGKNSMSGMDRFLPGAQCLGDILKEADYHLLFMQGASIVFSGKDKFYRDHGFDEIYGRNELKDRLGSSNYLNAWGLYDDTTFDIAFEKFEKLSAKGEPFALFVMTLDTHHPDGHISKKCRIDGTDRYADGTVSILNAVRCSDHLISDFIHRIEKSKYADNTIIVLTSDHLAMRNGAIKRLEKAQRSDLFVIVDPDEKRYRAITKTASMLDVTPTILEKLGLDTDLGFGRNLFRRDSLFGRFENFNDKLDSWREKILGLWEFSEMGKSFIIDTKRVKVHIPGHDFTYPMFMEITESGEVMPHFDFDSEESLTFQLSNLERSRNFIWVDHCEKIEYMKNATRSQGLCVAMGRLDSDISIKHIGDGTNVISMNEMPKSHDISEEEIRNRIRRLKSAKISAFTSPSYDRLFDRQYEAALSEGIDFAKKGYPSFLLRVYGISDWESQGRWTDANLHPEAVFVFADKLPKRFTLSVRFRPFGDNFGKYLTVKVGGKTKRILIDERKSKEYRIAFDDIDSDRISLIPPKPASLPNDHRKLGIYISKMKITK
jgi:phosphoglycerol transferase